MNIDLQAYDAIGQAELIARGEISASELLESTLERIAKLEPRVHAIAELAAEQARARLTAGIAGPFAGVPILLKDLIAYPGIRHSMGCRLFRSNVAQEGSPYTDAIEAAGFVVLGKTTTSELGLLGSTETLLEGVTKNPWDPSRSAGGSSGGAAAAVASGMVPIAHASDGGGSIRLPASLNGVFGFKPGVSVTAPSSPDDMHGLLVDHCVSRTVRDSARLLELTRRPDSSIDLPLISTAEPSSTRLRIGVYRETLLGELPSSAVSAALDATVELCRSLGHEVIESEAPPIDGAALSDAFFTVAASKMAALKSMMESMMSRAVGEDDLEPFTLELIEWGSTKPAGAVEIALETFERSSAQMQRYLQSFDAALCPTTPDEVPPLGTLQPGLGREALIRRTERFAGYTPIHNIAGVPAMSLPLHVSGAGLPVGSHFAAARGGEALLFGLAFELERAAPWVGRRPAILDL